MSFASIQRMLSSRVAAMESIDELPGVRYHPAITDQAKLIARWIEIICERGYCHWDGKIYKAVHDRLTKKGYLVTKRLYLNSDSDIYDWKELSGPSPGMVIIRAKCHSVNRIDQETSSHNTTG